MSWRRILVLTAAFLLLLTGGTWLLLRQTGATTGLVRSGLQRLLAAPFALDAASFDVAAGVLTVRGLALFDPDAPHRALLRCAEARVAVATNPLGELLAVHRVDLDGVELELDLGRPLPTPAQLLRRPPDDGREARLPPIGLQNGRLRIRPAGAETALEFDQLALQLQPAAGGRLALQGSVRSCQLDLPLQLRGVFDADGGGGRATASLAGLRIDAPLLAAVQPLLPWQLPAAALRGELRQLQAWCELGPADDGSGGFACGAAAEFEHLACDLPEQPYPLRDASLQLSASTRQHGSARLQLREQTAAGGIDLRADVTGLWQPAPHLELHGRTTGTAIDADLLAAMRRFATGRNLLAALAPTAGRVDVELYLRDPGGADELVEVDVGVRDASLRYVGFGRGQRIGFPLPLQRAAGTVRVRERLIQLLDIHAAIADEAGGGDVTCSGRVVLGDGGGGELVEVDVDAEPVQFTPALRQAIDQLVPGGGELHDRFAPAGSAAVSVRVRTGDADDPWQVRVRPLLVSAAWAAFPYRVQLDGGQVLARPAGIDIDVRGRAGDDGGQLHLDGRLLPDAGGGFDAGSMQLHLTADDAPIDRRLRDAAVQLLPELLPVWDVLRPHGRAAGELAVWRAAGEREPRYDLRLSVLDAVVQPTPLDLRVEHVHGTIYASGQGHDHHIDVDALRGAATTAPASGPAAIAVIGTMATRRPIGADFTAVIRDLHLDPQLAAALARIDVLDRTTWDVLRPSGVVDCLLHWQRTTPTAKPTEHLTVHLRDVRSDAAMLPQPATGVSGELQIDDGVVTFRDLHADIGQAKVVCASGHVRPADDGVRKEVAFSVSSERFPLDDDITRLFDGPLKQSLLDRQLRGAVNVDELNLRFLVPPGGGKGFTTIMSGRFAAVDVSMLAGTRIDAIHGLVRLDESRVDDGGGTLRGSIEKGSLRLFRHSCTDLRAGFVADATELQLRDVGFSLHNGRVRSPEPDAVALRYRFAAPPDPAGTLSLDLTWDGVSLAELLRQSGWSGYHFHGSMLGELHLSRLHGTDFVNLEARGRLAVADGDLGTVPLFTAIYAQLNDRNRPRFESGNIDFAIADGQVQLKQLELRSPMLSVDGSGSMTMDGYVDVTLALDDLFGSSPEWLIVPSVVRGLARRLLRFHLYGFLRNLAAEQRWFTEQRPPRRPLRPVPPRLERPQRPDF